MNRLQKKCFFAATGFHLLLLVILLVGPAFLSSREKPDDSPLLDFVPMKTIDAALSDGGNPRATPPPPAPQPQPPAPQPQVNTPPSRPEPVKEIVRSPEPSLEPVEKKRRIPDVSTKIATRSRPKTTKSSTSDTDKEARAAAQRREAFNRALSTLRDGLSSSTTVEMPGPGGGGVTYASFRDGLKRIYSDAWIVPDGVTDDEATATASVTIARDGSVLNAHIVRRSGNPLADASVEAALRRVTKAVPLPDDAKEDQRTVTIKFNVKAKRGLG